MTEQEKEKLIAAVIAEHGEPIYEGSQWDASNTSAYKIIEIRKLFNKARQDVTKTKRLTERINDLAGAEAVISPVRIPESVIRPEWLVPFNERQRKIVDQWIKNTEQTAKQISLACNCTSDSVKAVMSLEAFKILQRQIAIGWKDLLPLKAISRLDKLLDAKTDSVQLKAILTILIDQGVIKSNAVPNDKQDVTLDKETLDQLYKDTNKFMGLEKDNDE